MSGPQLAEVLCTAAEIPVIFISGYSAELLEEKGSIPKGAQVLCKPFSRQDLVTTVRRLIDLDIDPLHNLETICVEVI